MLTIDTLWSEYGFTPNPKQREAILHVDGPLFLTAGPGSGKTRVLLWRTLNLIVFHNVDPKEIFLSTFTEKAARQLKDGLRSLLGFASNYTNKPYDISKMSVGTVHSICQNLITDRCFSNNGNRVRPPIVMDALGQYFKLYRHSYWNELITAGGYTEEVDAQRAITQYLNGKPTGSRHVAVLATQAIFNRFSEENLEPEKVKTSDPTLKALLKMYAHYLQGLSSSNIKAVDLSLLQQTAYKVITGCAGGDCVFKHIIIDEYQDTNNIQECIFFALAKGSRNICVVGDDDQALYRFRGATVENLVEFENRCMKYIGRKPQRIDLSTNYRSRKQIVDFYTKFIDQIDWQKQKPQKGAYRVTDKKIKANSKDSQTAVVVSKHAKADSVYAEVAAFVKKLKDTGKIEDYCQCAFLFPALKTMGNTNSRVQGFTDAFKALGIEVYSPRAGNFFNIEEIRVMLGCMLLIFDRPHYGDEISRGLREYKFFLIGCMNVARQKSDADYPMRKFIADKKAEVQAFHNDYEQLMAVVKRKKWDITSTATGEMITTLKRATDLSQRAIKNMSSKYFLNLLQKRKDEGRPVTLEYVVNRATSLDWSVLDLFYQLCSFDYFREMFDLAEQGKDEAYVCNLAMFSEYLGRFMEEKTPIITAATLHEDKFSWMFFGSFFYALYRLGQTEYEDEEVPFPNGRVPFLTIHQSKGLEFPVVVLGSLYKQEFVVDTKEEIMRQLLKKDGEPLSRMQKFDMMRMFYVGLSRSKNLLVLPRYTHGKNAIDEFRNLVFNDDYTQISQFKINTLPSTAYEEEDLGKTYSYTADYLNYQRCPRQYMLFRKYGFVTSRSQNQYFGTLVHQTLEDLHHLLKTLKTAAHEPATA